MTRLIHVRPPRTPARAIAASRRFSGVRAAARELFEALPGLFSLPVARGPRYFMITGLLLAAGCVLLLAGLLVTAHQQPLSAAELKLADWQASCLRGEAPVMPWQVTPCAGSAPGQGRYAAGGDGRVCGQVSLAEAEHVLGQPVEAPCLDYGLLPERKAAVWLRLLFAQGKIEAYLLLGPETPRLSPEMPIHTLRCTLHAGPLAVTPATPWPVFMPLTGFPGCQHVGGTALPH